jgi:hypothetical protein
LGAAHIETAHASAVSDNAPRATCPAARKTGRLPCTLQEEPIPMAAVDTTSRYGSTPMLKSLMKETREILWLASVVGGLSAVGVGIAVALVAV